MHRAAAVSAALLVGVDAVEPDAVGVAGIGIDVGERRHVAAGVPFLAARHAGLAADAGVEVDDEAELFLGRAAAGSSSHRLAQAAELGAEGHPARSRGKAGRRLERRKLWFGTPPSPPPRIGAG